MKKLLAITGTLLLATCGGSSPTAPTPTPAPVPATSITATGNGALVVAPSKYTTWAYSLVTPIRIVETAGGSAKWNFARITLLKSGVQLEVAEIGADVLSAPPDSSNITAQQSLPVSLIFRLNSTGFDRVDITLGFSDKKDGRSFTVLVPFSSFSDVTTSLTPMANPTAQIEVLSERRP